MTGQILSGLTLIAALVAAFLTYIHMRDRVQRDFLALQPDVKAVGASHKESDGVYMFILRIHNLRDSPAYDATITMDGWCGSAKTSEIHPLVHPVYGGRRDNEVALEIGPEDPIRKTKLKAPRLQIHFRDRWELSYELSYPVAQSPQTDGLFQIDVLYAEPTLIKPKVSFWKMRKCIREIPSL